MRLGVFGGTFDPVHRGHLGLAGTVVEVFALDTLVFVPAAVPPHKRGERVTSFAHRFAMLALALAPWERFLLSDVEQGRQGPSSTVETLRELRARWGADELVFVMGSDSLAQIGSWYHWEELVELAHLAVVRRHPYWGEELDQHVPAPLRRRVRPVHPDGGVNTAWGPAGGQVFLLEQGPGPISATEVRARLGAGREVEGLVPPLVARYARQHRLYDRNERRDRP